MNEDRSGVFAGSRIGIPQFLLEAAVLFYGKSHMNSLDIIITLVLGDESPCNGASGSNQNEFALFRTLFNRFLEKPNNSITEREYSEAAFLKSNLETDSSNSASQSNNPHNVNQNVSHSMNPNFNNSNPAQPTKNQIRDEFRGLSGMISNPEAIFTPTYSLDPDCVIGAEQIFNRLLGIFTRFKQDSTLDKLSLVGISFAYVL